MLGLFFGLALALAVALGMVPALRLGTPHTPTSRHLVDPALALILALGVGASRSCSSLASGVASAPSAGFHPVLIQRFSTRDHMEVVPPGPALDLGADLGGDSGLERPACAGLGLTAWAASSSDPSSSTA